MAQILVDTSVRHHAVAIKGHWVDTGTVLWGGKIPVNTGYLVSIEQGHKVKVSKGGDQTRYIAALARAFMNGEHEAHSTDALVLETMHQEVGKYAGYGYGDTSLFRDVAFSAVHHTLNGCSVLIPPDDPVNALRQFLRDEPDSCFNEILAALGGVVKSGKHCQDAWHLRCAMFLGMSAFLSVDTVLIGHIKSIADKELRHKLLEVVQLPVELCNKLGILPMSDKDFDALVAELGIFPLKEM